MSTYVLTRKDLDLIIHAASILRDDGHGDWHCALMDLAVRLDRERVADQ